MKVFRGDEPELAKDKRLNVPDAELLLYLDELHRLSLMTLAFLALKAANTEQSLAEITATMKKPAIKSKRKVSK
jgi:hypothetical protein